MNQWSVMGKYLIWVTTLSFSLIGPVVFCLLGASYLQKRFLLGGWLMPTAIVLGLIGGAANVLRFFRFMQKEAEKDVREDNDGPV